MNFFNRGSKKTNNSPYRYDISDKVWDLIKDIIPGNGKGPGRKGNNNRAFINAVFWRLRTGAPWRDLPESYGNYNTIHKRYRRWAEKNI